jgi:hypothetical protein
MESSKYQVREEIEVYNQMAFLVFHKSLTIFPDFHLLSCLDKHTPQKMTQSTGEKEEQSAPKSKEFLERIGFR